MDSHSDGLAHRDLTDRIIGAFYRVYNTLGFGFLEAPYVLAMELELRKAGLQVGREVQVRLYYEEIEIMQYRLDMLIEGAIVVEIKASERLHPAAERQLHNYLRATNLEVGLLLHFGPEARFKRVYAPNRGRRSHPRARSGSGSSESSD